MNDIVPFDFNGLKVRTATDERGEPWFMAKDVCDALELANSRKAISDFDNEDLMSLVVTSGGQKREMNFVSEAGLYQLIFKSRKEEAKAFKRWVTKEVLPSIRKTGGYTLTNPAQMANIIEEVIVRVSRGISLTPHKRKPGAPLSDEEKDTLDRLADDYWAYAEMAREIGCDPKTVSRYLKQREKERAALEEESKTPTLFDSEEAAYDTSM